MQQWKRVNGNALVYLGMDQVLFHLCLQMTYCYCCLGLG